jgi:hypothetical protein
LGAAVAKFGAGNILKTLSDSPGGAMLPELGRPLLPLLP